MRGVSGVVKAHPRLFLAIAFAVLVAVLLPDHWITRGITRWILAWNAGVWLYLFLAGWMVAHSGDVDIRRRARGQDEGARVILLLVVVSAFTSLGAIVAELSVAHGETGPLRIAHIVLAVATLLASWTFTQLMFALHYAHQYYGDVAQGRAGGLLFPGTEVPDYLDFLYFSAVIGTSGQTADVSLSSPAMRRLGLIHCVLAYLFNTSLIALLINVASSLL